MNFAGFWGSYSSRLIVARSDHHDQQDIAEHKWPVGLRFSRLRPIRVLAEYWKAQEAHIIIQRFRRS